MGSCNSAASACSWAGYAFEVACHTAVSCIYDVVGDLGWRVSIGTHSLRSVIDNVILPYETVPECVATPECVDCFNWKYYESHNRTGTTTSSSATSRSKSITQTRTSTCKTPGWWGCLDETTTTSRASGNYSRPITTTETTSKTTSTCKTPGWFGCLDKTTTTTTITSRTSVPRTTTTSTTSTTCLTPGWWGCRDKTSTTSTQTASRAGYTPWTPRMTAYP